MCLRGCPPASRTPAWTLLPGYPLPGTIAMSYQKAGRSAVCAATAGLALGSNPFVGDLAADAVPGMRSSFNPSVVLTMTLYR